MVLGPKLSRLGPSLFGIEVSFSLFLVLQEPLECIQHALARPKLAAVK